MFICRACLVHVFEARFGQGKVTFHYSHYPLAFSIKSIVCPVELGLNRKKRKAWFCARISRGNWVGKRSFYCFIIFGRLGTLLCSALLSLFSINISTSLSSSKRNSKNFLCSRPSNSNFRKE